MVWQKIYEGNTRAAEDSIWTAGTNRSIEVGSGFGGGPPVEVNVWSIPPSPAEMTLAATTSFDLPADVEGFYPTSPNGGLGPSMGAQDPYTFDLTLVAISTGSNKIYLKTLIFGASSIIDQPWVTVSSAPAGLTGANLCKFENVGVLNCTGSAPGLTVQGVDLLTGQVTWTRTQAGYGVDAVGCQAIVSADVWLGGFEQNDPGSLGQLESQYIYAYVQGANVGTIDLGSSPSVNSGAIHPMANGSILATWVRYDSSAFNYWDLCARPISASSSGISWASNDVTILGSGNGYVPNRVMSSHHQNTVMIVFNNTWTSG